MFGLFAQQVEHGFQLFGEFALGFFNGSLGRLLRIFLKLLQGLGQAFRREPRRLRHAGHARRRGRGRRRDHRLRQPAPDRLHCDRADGRDLRREAPRQQDECPPSSAALLLICGGKSRFSTGSDWRRL